MKLPFLHRIQKNKRVAELTNVASFTAAYLCIAAYGAYHTQNWEFVFYIAVILLLILLTVLVHLKVGLSHGVLWNMSIWGALHMIGGLVPIPDTWPIDGSKHVFYSLWLIPNILKYDHVIHAYGFGIATWLCWQGLKPALRNQYPTSGILILCAIAGMGLGAMNEVVEFFATLLVPDTNVGGYANTGWDLVANLIGSVTAVAIIGISEGAKRVEGILHA